MYLPTPASLIFQVPWPFAHVDFGDAAARQQRSAGVLMCAALTATETVEVFDATSTIDGAVITTLAPAELPPEP